MEVIIKSDAGAASLVAAQLVAKLVRSKPAAVLGLATGSTPLALYRELIRLHREEDLDFSRVTTFNLDEYVGLPGEHPCSYHTYMRNNLFKQINVQTDRINIPNGLAANIEAHCADYERRIQEAGGIDLQILGIGSDGHIGFNEPSSSLSSRTRIKTLTESTRRDNADQFGSADKVPRHVITMGIGTILESRTCVLLAFGSKKSDAVAKTVEGPLTAMAPASALQLHKNAKIIIDEAAAKLLAKREYFEYVYKSKPDWQHNL